MPVDSLTKDDVAKCNAALFDLMTSGRLILIDEGSEVERRREQPGLKNRSQAASRKELNQAEMISWSEFFSSLPEDSVGGGGGGGYSSLLLSSCPQPPARVPDTTEVFQTTESVSP
eukprot:1516051-Pyramimonas_sp.AAC.1